jgi:hypothetical protein
MTTNRDMPQFMHINSYARQPGKVSRRNGHRSAGEIIAELLREPHASAHVANPQPPRILRGDPAKALLNAQQMAEEGRDALGRRLRIDAHILAGCVCSYPVPITELKDDPAGPDGLHKWIRESIRWADAEFGESQIGAIVLHVDETLPHLHMILTPPAPGAEPSPIRRAAKVAAAAAKNQEHVRKIERRAYKAEARRLQDSFFGSVSILFGHTRHGRHSRRRLSPRQRQIENSQALALLQARQRAAALTELLKKQWNLLSAQSSRLAQLERKVATWESELQRWEHSLRARAKLIVGPIQSVLETIVKKIVAELPNWLRPYGERATAAAFNRAWQTVQSDLSENPPEYSLERNC